MRPLVLYILFLLCLPAMLPAQTPHLFAATNLSHQICIRDSTVHSTQCYNKSSLQVLRTTTTVVLQQTDVPAPGTVALWNAATAAVFPAPTLDSVFSTLLIWLNQNNNPCAIVGPTGATGATGASGPPGPTGAAGVATPDTLHITDGRYLPDTTAATNNIRTLDIFLSSWTQIDSLVTVYGQFIARTGCGFSPCAADINFTLPVPAGTFPYLLLNGVVTSINSSISGAVTQGPGNTAQVIYTAPNDSAYIFKYTFSYVTDSPLVGKIVQGGVVGPTGPTGPGDSYWTLSDSVLSPIGQDTITVSTKEFISTTANGKIVNSASLPVFHIPFTGVIKQNADNVALSGLINPYADSSSTADDTSSVFMGYIKPGQGFYGVEVKPVNGNINLATVGHVALNAAGSTQLELGSDVDFHTDGAAFLDAGTIQITTDSLGVQVSGSATVQAQIIKQTANVVQSNATYHLYDSSPDSLNTNTATYIKEIYQQGDGTFKHNTGTGGFSNIHTLGRIAGNVSNGNNNIGDIYQFSGNNSIQNNTVNSTYDGGIPQLQWVTQIDNSHIIGNSVTDSAFAIWDVHQGESDSMCDNVVKGYASTLDDLTQRNTDKFSHNRFIGRNGFYSDITQDGYCSFQRDTFSGANSQIFGLKMFNSSIEDCHWRKANSHLNGVNLYSSNISKYGGSLDNMYLFNYTLDGRIDTTNHFNQVWFGGAGIRIVDGTQGAGKVLISDASGNATWSRRDSIYMPVYSKDTNIVTVVPDSFTYTRNGNTITSYGTLWINSASAGRTTFDITLPIAATTVHLSGYGGNVNNETVEIDGDASVGRAKLAYLSTGTGLRRFKVSFQYPLQ